MNDDGAVSGHARFCAFAIFQKASTLQWRQDDDSVAMTGGDNMGVDVRFVVLCQTRAAAVKKHGLHMVGSMVGQPKRAVSQRMHTFVSVVVFCVVSEAADGQAALSKVRRDRQGRAGPGQSTSTHGRRWAGTRTRWRRALTAWRQPDGSVQSGNERARTGPVTAMRTLHTSGRRAEDLAEKMLREQLALPLSFHGGIVRCKC